LVGSSFSYVGTTTNKPFHIYQNNASALEFNTSKDAAFAGAITSSDKITTGAVSGDGLVLPKTGTATSTAQTYNSPDIRLEASGWDTNNSFARTVSWVIRNEPTASVYPDFDLNFIQRADGSDATTFTLHGRGTSGHVDPKAGTFFGNLHVEAGTGTNAGAGALTVADDITASGKIYGGGSNVSSGYTGVFGETQVGASSGQKLLYFYIDGTTLKIDAYDYSTSSALSFDLAGNGGDVNIGSSADLKMNGTTVLTSARALQNISTISASGTATFNELTLTGGSDNLTIKEAAGDWTIKNVQQNNGITIYDGGGGVDINYNGSAVITADSTGIVLGDTVYANNPVYLNDWTYMDVAGQNFVLASDTATRTTLDWTVSGTSVWNLQLTDSAHLNFIPSGSYQLQVSGSQVVTDARIQAGTTTYSTTGNVVSGRDSGGVALTINDSKGNANVTFNHANGVPEQNGNAARIEVNTDSTTGAAMYFELKSGVTDGVGVDLTNIMALDESGLNMNSGMGISISGTEVISSSRDLTPANITATGNISGNTIQIGGTTVIDASRNISCENLTLGSNGSINAPEITAFSSGTPQLTVNDIGNGGGGGASGKLIFRNTAGNAIGIGYTDDETSNSDLIISTNAAGTYGGYLGLDALAIADSQADIILEPKGNVRIATGGLYIGTAQVIDSARNLTNINSFTVSSFTATSSATVGGFVTGAELTIAAINTAGSPATSTSLKMQGYEGRGIGTFYEDVSYSGEEWFAGMPYAGQFDYYQIGYDSGGGAAEYSSNSIARFTSSGDFQMGTTTVIDSTGKFTAHNTLAFVDSDFTYTTEAKTLNNGGITFDLDSGNAIADTDFRIRIDRSSGNSQLVLDASGNLDIEGALNINGTSVITAARNLTNIGTISSGTITSSGRVLGGGSAVSPGYGGVYGEYGAGASSGQKLLYLYNNGSTLKLDAYDYTASAPLSFAIGGNGGDVNFANTNVKVDGVLFIDGDRNIYLGNSTTLRTSEGRETIADNPILLQNGSSLPWGSLTPERPIPSIQTRAEAGNIGTNSTNYPDVYGEADLTGITGDVTFTYAAALQKAQELGGRLPTLEEVMSGSGAGSGQGYDDDLLWTQTPAGHGKHWVVRGSYSGTTSAEIADDTSSYRIRVFFDASRAYKPVHFNWQGVLPTDSVKMIGSSFNVYNNGDTNRFSIDSSGNCIAEGNVTAYGAASDIRLKENIEPITEALDKVKRLDGVTFNYKKDGSRSTGVIAQQVQEVLPEVIYESAELGKEDGEKFLAVRYGQMMGLAIEAIKELSAEVDSLKAKLKELEDGNH
jgi:hypothetical protein